METKQETRNRPIWQLAKENNEKEKIVTRRVNPNCRRLGIV